MKRAAFHVWSVLVIVTMAQLSGCGRAPTLDPPVLHLGQDTCHACSMIVSEARFAAAVVTIHDGQRQQYLFDDLGEMLRFTPPHPSQVRYWAHDFQTSHWIDATKAYFVQAKAIHTPMGTGVVAYTDKTAAQNAAKSKQGRVMTFDQIRQKQKLDQK